MSNEVQKKLLTLPVEQTERGIGRKKGRIMKNKMQEMAKNRLFQTS
jgi:hypothetical protein